MNLSQSLTQIKQALSNQTRRALGSLGEIAAQWMFEHAGYDVVKASRKQGDLRIVNRETGEVHQVEVKAARLSTDRKFRFLLYKKGKTDYRNADVIVLLAVLKSGEFVPFVIPVSVLGERSQICISGCYPWKYNGVWQRYRQNERSIHL